MPISKEGNTIQDLEKALEKNLAGLPIAPQGYRPVVELLENGRKKRRTASALSWSAKTGEVRIRFEQARRPSDEVSPESPGLGKDEKTKSGEVTPLLPPPVAAAAPDRRLPGLLKALEDAETAPGRMFVALKWFRDEYLPSTGVDWAQNREERQDVLTRGIQAGWILTGKVANPKAPPYPTTTIRLNRQKQPASAPAIRFRPVPISGEPLSRTILLDRGAR